ncbi:hypothetical protein CVT26_009553 [Gymnopilus dilepis]|uniref:DUF3074 domain-containing protein n=1 Tax=Gymnopilus dilepis TaxID=231916 RepID=A0A409VKC4_9AGAR|nr:hypothetical protein CVT26_009553 [Gymnopilus dilepis]
MDGRPTFKIPANCSLTPLKISSEPDLLMLLGDIPPENELLSDAQTVLDASLDWTLRKAYPNGKAYFHLEFDSGKKKTHTWHCVVTELHRDEVSFGQLWAKLGRNKAYNQRRYVAGIDKVTRVKYISESQSIWTTLFIHPPPMSPRVYTSHHSRATNLPIRKRIVVTLPIDLSSKTAGELSELEEKGIKGRYVSIEHIREIDGDLLEWRQIVGVDARGLIPKFWVHRKMGKNLLQEFSACVEWLKNSRLDETSGEDEVKRIKGDHKDVKVDAKVQTEEEVVEEVQEIDYPHADTNTQTI